ncbi:MAG: OstA-like protein, partial [Sphingobacteriales bacterium]
MKKLFFIITSFILWGLPSLAQQKNKIIIENADFSNKDQTEIPGAIVLTGNVQILHDGVRMWCNKGYLFEAENYFKAFGDFKMNQGDTLFMD